MVVLKVMYFAQTGCLLVYSVVCMCWTGYIFIVFCQLIQTEFLSLGLPNLMDWWHARSIFPLLLHRVVFFTYPCHLLITLSIFYSSSIIYSPSIISGLKLMVETIDLSHACHFVLSFVFWHWCPPDVFALLVSVRINFSIKGQQFFCAVWFFEVSFFEVSSLLLSHYLFQLAQLFILYFFATGYLLLSQVF